jgi:hypothetical protein
MAFRKYHLQKSKFHHDSKNGRVMITEASVEEIQYAHGE